MSVNYPIGYVNPSCFEEVAIDCYLYHSPLQARDYKLTYNQKTGRWECDCPDARYRKRKEEEGRCKHELAINRLLQEKYENRCMAEIEAEETAEAAESQSQTDQSAEIEELQKQIEIMKISLENAHHNSKTYYNTLANSNNYQDRLIFQLQDEINTLKREAKARDQAPAQQPDLTAIMEELAALRQENQEIKKQLATKATARRKHQTEQEAAEIKRDMNLLASDVIEAANTAIQTVSMLQERLADLEAIPHSLKTELDAWTAAGKEELQPGYKAEEPADDIKASMRADQEAAAKRRNAPLNGNDGFNLLKRR